MPTPPQNRLDQDLLAGAVAELIRCEPRFAIIVQQHGLPSLRQQAGGLEGLLMIVTEQFLSLAAAGAIWRRLAGHIGVFTPERILDTGHDVLLSLGLSRAKAKAFHGIALAQQQGSFDPPSLEILDDAAAHRQLVALPGVGPWTADIYLLSVLLRADAWPAGDVALQEAARHLFGLAQRPTTRQLQAMGEPFRPWRAVAARLLWSHYRGLKAMAQA